MIAARPTIRRIAPSRREGAALLAACAAVDAVTAGILLFGTPLPLSLEGVAAAVSHATAVLLLCGLAPARPSLRWVCGAAMLAVPCVGAAVAAAVLATRGRGTAAVLRRRRTRRRPALTLAAVQRLRATLSPCDALECGDEDQRRAALWALSRREDPEAIALLHRTADRDPDLALSAALVLDEIGERAERRAGRLGPPGVRHAAG